MIIKGLQGSENTILHYSKTEILGCWYLSFISYRPYIYIHFMIFRYYKCAFNLFANCGTFTTYVVQFQFLSLYLNVLE